MVIHRHRVGFAEVDAAGIAFFSRAFEIAHAAFETMLIEIGLPLQEILSKRDWVMPLVHAEADYSLPMKLGMRLEIAVALERISDRSMTLVFTISSGEGRVEHAVVRHVHACVDRLSGQGRPLPEDLVLAMKRL